MIVLEFVEVGGNKGFDAVCRQPYFQLPVDGVLFVYSRDHTQSAVSLLAWYRELQEARVLGGEGGAGKPFLIVETVLRQTPVDLMSDGLMRKSSSSSDQRPSRWASGLINDSPSSSRSRVFWLLLNTFQRIQTAAYVFSACVHRVLVLVMTCLLFGPSHSTIQWSVPSGAKVLDELHGDSLCRGEIRGFPLFHASAHEARVEALDDLFYFVSRL
jgi:hypothetical protein